MGRGVVRNLKPEQASVLRPPYASRSDQMTRNVPSAVVAISWITLAEIIAVDQRPVQPEFSQQGDIPCAINKVTIRRHFKAEYAPMHFRSSPTGAGKNDAFSGASSSLTVREW